MSNIVSVGVAIGVAIGACIGVGIGVGGASGCWWRVLDLRCHLAVDC